MLTLKALTKGTNFDSLDPHHKNNLEMLLARLKALEQAYGQEFSVTSGYRTMEDHLRIYKAKGITDKARIPMQSRHLIGAAADIFAPPEFHKWVLANVPLLEKLGLWCEDLKYTPNWVHFSIHPPRSGSRFFKP